MKTLRIHLKEHGDRVKMELDELLRKADAHHGQRTPRPDHPLQRLAGPRLGTRVGTVELQVPNALS